MIRILENVRQWAGDIVDISSGFRCEKHNATIPGASPNSFHTSGRAADIVVRGKTPKQVYEYLNKRYPNRLGIGRYVHHVHVDSDESRRRW